MKKAYVAMIIAAFMATRCSTAKVKVGNKTISINKAQTGDYFDSGTVLAAMGMLGGGYSEVSFYPARVLQQASKDTKNETKVESMLGTSDVAKGATMWTPLVVFKSHPAKKDEIKKGMLVMAVLGSNPETPEELKHSTWNRVLIIDTDEMYKNNVKIRYFWTWGKNDESDRTREIPLTNIRVIDSANFKTSM